MKLRFLEVLERTESVTQACKSVRRKRTSAYYARDSDPAFKEAWLELGRQFDDDLKDGCRKRASKGWTEDVWHKGAKVGKKRVYSDTLARFMYSVRFGLGRAAIERASGSGAEPQPDEADIPTNLAAAVKRAHELRAQGIKPPSIEPKRREPDGRANVTPGEFPYL